MTDEQFDQLVKRIQQRYGSRPLWLRVRTAWLVVVGYAGFLAGLLLVLAISAGLTIAAVVAGTEPSIFLMAIVAVLLAFGLWQTLVFLWVPLKTAKARVVTEDEVPMLFRVLKKLEDDYRTPPFYSVQVTSDFNASVQMVPQWGVFGFNRTHLFLGLPLMQMLSPEQFAAVLAHEFAHSSSRHDRFGMWIYRLRQTWSRVFTELQSGGKDAVLSSFRGPLMGFINWYWPRFNAHAFVLSRANEYQADRIAAEWGGASALAQALWRIECFGRRLNDDFWNELTLLARSHDEVPDDVVLRMNAFLDEEPKPEDGQRWIEQSSQFLTGSIDTHPSLSDRLQALGLDVREFARDGFPIPAAQTADVLLGPERDQIEQDVNAQWQQKNRLRWQNVFHQARRLEKRLVTTDAAAEPTTLTVEQLWEQARTVGQLQGTAAAEPLLRQLLEQTPLHGNAAIVLGSHLLERGNNEGEQFLRHILSDPEHEMIPAACGVLSAHFQELGQSEKVRDMQAIVSRFQTAQVAAATERSVVTVKDPFVPHGLSETELVSLRATLAAQTEIAAAWLVRKELKHFQKQKLFVLVARTKPSGLFGGSNADRDRALVTALMSSVKLPGRLLIVAPQGGFRALAQKIMASESPPIVP